MKKTLLILACTLLLALTMTATVGAYAFLPGSDAVVYVDGTAGNDANSGATPAAAVATPQKAQSLLPNGGTVVVSGETALTAAYNPAAVNGAVLYTSVYGGTDYRKSGAKLSVGGNMTFSNDTYFDNIDLAITKSTLIFSGKFHNFGFGAGVSCTQAATATTFHYPIILAGANTPATLEEASSDADFTLTIAGGTWRSFYGGNRRTGASQVLGKVSGDSYIRIEGGTFTGSGGEYASLGGANIHTGRMVLEITDGVFNCEFFMFRRTQARPTDSTKDAGGYGTAQAVFVIRGGQFNKHIASGPDATIAGSIRNYADLTMVITGGSFAGSMKFFNRSLMGTVLIRCSAETEAMLRPHIENIHNFLFSNDLSPAEKDTETAHFAGMISNTPDPFVFEKDGMYYIAYGDGDGISVSASREMVFSRFDYNKVKVFKSSETNIANAKKEYWAPEIHYFSADEVGKDNAGWYIYFAADDGKDANHRMYVLRATDPEDAQSAYKMVGELETADDCWAIDGTVMKLSGKLYFIWSGHPTDSSTQQIYIQEMESPSKMKDGARTLLAAPTESWERRNSPLLEGPQALVLNGTAHIVYSANGSWTRRYCLGMLTLVGSDPLDAAAWQKSDGPVFEMSEETAMFGTGHASFVENSIDGTHWIYYHAVPNASVKDGNDANGTPVFWNARRTFAQQFTTETKRVNGKTLTYPVFGAPLAASTVRDVAIHTPDHCDGAHLYAKGGNVCLICRATSGAPDLKYGDMNDDGKIELIDALLLLRAMVNGKSDAALSDVVRLLRYIATGK